MSTDPDEIRYDIERTRSELSSDVDALTDKVSPSRVIERQKSRVRATASSWRDAVMGSADDAAGSARGAASDVKGAVASAPDEVRDRTRGNPFAAGLVAFGVGLIASALIPSSRPEQQAAQAVKEHAEPLVEQAKQSASQVAGNLKEPARDAANEVADTARAAGERVRDQAQASAQDVAGTAQDATQTVRASAGDGSGSESATGSSASGSSASAGVEDVQSTTPTWPSTFEPEEDAGDADRQGWPPVPPA